MAQNINMENLVEEMCANAHDFYLVHGKVKWTEGMDSVIYSWEMPTNYEDEKSYLIPCHDVTGKIVGVQVEEYIYDEEEGQWSNSSEEILWFTPEQKKRIEDSIAEQKAKYPHLEKCCGREWYTHLHNYKVIISDDDERVEDKATLEKLFRKENGFEISKLYQDAKELGVKEAFDKWGAAVL